MELLMDMHDSQDHARHVQRCACCHCQSVPNPATICQFHPSSRALDSGSGLRSARAATCTRMRAHTERQVCIPGRHWRQDSRRCRRRSVEALVPWLPFRHVSHGNLVDHDGPVAGGFRELRHSCAQRVRKKKGRGYGRTGRSSPDKCSKLSCDRVGAPAVLERLTVFQTRPNRRNAAELVHRRDAKETVQRRRSSDAAKARTTTLYDRLV